MARPALFHRLLVANRGEVAVRVARSCDALGIEPVFAASQADRAAPYLRGRQVVLLGPARPSESYLDPMRVVQAAVQTRCSALHPGWGFLAESPLLASLCQAHGVTFIGPPAAVMQRMGEKTQAKRAAAAAGLAVIPGSAGVLRDASEARAEADRIGYPVLLKAECGGGGRGMRVAAAAGQVASAFAEAQSEAKAAFGDPRLYLEALVEGGRHIEIQVFADRYGRVVHLGERDCTVQRNHQKLIEESPSPVLKDQERRRSAELAAAAAAAIGYVGAGTMEFLLGEDGILRFLEMNTRLQVEHPVTEMRTGLDLVAEQIRVAAGNPLSLAQGDVALRGHALECRINAEDPGDGFRPVPGKIVKWQPPLPDAQLRIDTHVEVGYTVPPHYDSLLAKVIAAGATRQQACDRMIAALEQWVCAGVPTTLPMHRAVLSSPEFRQNRYDTRAIPGWPRRA